jgi:ABC-type Fe3+ transport system permease subunit
MPKITCYQCHQAYADMEPFCPHCGATRKENLAQKALRMARRALVGGGIGAIVGTVGALVLGVIFHLVKAQAGELWSQTLKTMAMIGFVIGGVLGAAVVLVRDMVREE